MTFRHRDAGTHLSRDEDNASNRHMADGQTLNDILYFDGSDWNRANPAAIRAILNVTNGADVTADNAPQTHKNSHDPEDGSDPLDTDTPVKVGSANAKGSSHSLARADHVHEREHAKYTDEEAQAACVSDAAYGAGWNGVTDVAPSKNAVYDKVALLSSDSGEGHISISPLSYDSIGQGTWAIGISSNQVLNYIFSNTSGVDGDNLSYKVYLAAGTYTLQLYTASHTDRGIADFDIDGVEVASFDLYVGVGWNTVKTQTSIAVATSGLKTLRVRADGKNESSSSYVIPLTSIALWRTA